LSSGPLSEQQLVGIIQERLKQVVVPQLSAELANLVTQRIALTLFGTTNPDSADRDQVKSPFSLVNVVKDQINELKEKLDFQHGETASELHKASIEPSIHLNAFLEKLMDPAYYFVYGSSTGIMYAGNDQNKRKDIDIHV